MQGWCRPPELSIYRQLRPTARVQCVKDLCDCGKVPFLEQLKTGQNSPDRQCSNAECSVIEKLMEKAIGDGMHLLETFLGRMRYNKLAWIDKTESNEANPIKCEAQPYNHSKPS